MQGTLTYWKVVVRPFVCITKLLLDYYPRKLEHSIAEYQSLDKFEISDSLILWYNS